MPILATIGHYESNLPCREIRKFHDVMQGYVSFFLYRGTARNIIKFIFLIILFGKISSSRSLSLSSAESETERMTDFKRFGLEPYSIEPTKSVAYGRNSVNDLANSYDTVTNDGDSRIGYKTWCKCECYIPMKTSIECVCCLEIIKTCKPIYVVFVRFYIRSTFCAMIFDVIILFVWFPPAANPWQIRIKVLHHLKICVYRFLWNILLCQSHLLLDKTYLLVSIFYKRAFNWIQGVP